MIKAHLPYDEQKALEAICKHHGVEDPALITDLATFGDWIHQSEVDKGRLGPFHSKPPYLIALLGIMGILHPKAPA